MGKKLSEDEWINKIEDRCKKYNFTFVRFVTNNDNIADRFCIIRCNTCNNEVKHKVSSLYHKMSCNYCKDKYKLTKENMIENILNICNDKHYDFIGFDNDNFNGVNTRITYKCKRCEKIIQNIKYKDFVYTNKMNSSHKCEENKIKSSTLLLFENSKRAENNIKQKIKETDFEFVNFQDDTYIGSEKTNVIIRCKSCNNIHSILYCNLMSSTFSGICRKCNPSSRKRKEIDINELKHICEKHGLTFVCMGNNINQNVKITTKCKTCGNTLRPVSLYHFLNNGKTCEYCKGYSRYTKETAEKKLSHVCDNKNLTFNGYVDGCYKNINSLISIHCNCCNKDICVKMSDVWKSDFHRCKSKEDLDIIKNKRKNKKEEYLKHRINGSGLYFISFAENDPMSIKKPHVKLKCKSCGKTMIYSFSTITKNINRSPLKCKHCGFYSLTENEAINIINKKCNERGFVFNGFDTDDHHYHGKLTKLILSYKSCSHVWKSTSIKMLIENNILCPNCEKYQWKMEKEIKNLLNENDINYIQDCRSRTLKWLKYKKSLSLDFYLPDYNVAIECQGEEHFRSIDYFGGDYDFNQRIKRDKIKLDLCERNGVKLLYYDSQNKHTTFLNKPVYNTINNILEIINKIKNENNSNI